MDQNHLHNHADRSCLEQRGFANTSVYFFREKRCNGYKISLNSRKITLATRKHQAQCRSASKSGEKSRAAIQMLLLEKHLLPCGSWDPPCASVAVPSGGGGNCIKHVCQCALQFSVICRSLT